MYRFVKSEYSSFYNATRKRVTFQVEVKAQSVISFQMQNN